MARTLDVYLNRRLAGRLVQDDHGRMGFAYAEAWLEDPAATALSHSLPLRSAPYATDECRGFFGGILPEDDKRSVLARVLGISERNDFALLERIGGECAGAVTFVASGEHLATGSDRYRILTNGRLAEILRELPRRPLMAGEDGVRLSLAGAQDKIAVFASDGRFSLPLGDAPSTHIIKPAIDRLEGVVFNEAVCLALARSIGLTTAGAELGRADGVDYLLIERYDRVRLPARGAIERLHQEDFCQALGIVSEHKYQNEGGPSLKQCFALLREASSVPVIDLQSLLDSSVFNFLIGNHDAHGKNFSLIYQAGQTRFAPLYDVVSTAYYPELTRRMAMKIGGEYESSQVAPRHFDRLAEEAGLGKPMVRQRVRELADAVADAIPALEMAHPAAERVASFVRERCEQIRERFRFD